MSVPKGLEPAASVPAHATMSPDEAKFKELVLYVAQQCETDPAFGATKLNKILFYADFSSYLRRGKPITGVAYRHLKWGPAPRILPSIKEELEKRSEAREKEVPYPTGTQKRLVPFRQPDLSKFSAEEISLVDEIIRWLWGKRAEEVSDLSHLETGWRITSEGEDIPYETVILDDRAPSHDAIAWAKAQSEARRS